MENMLGTARMLFNVEVLLVLIIMMMGGGALGRFVVEKNSILVISPDSIKGKKDGAIGNFGVPEYGGTMIGNVVYPDKGQSACTSFEELGVSFNHSTSRSAPIILLVDRGGGLFPCSPSTASRFMLIIILHTAIYSTLVSFTSPRSMKFFGHMSVNS